MGGLTRANLGRRTLPAFELAAPRSLESAAALCAAAGGSAEVLAGGVELISRMRTGVDAPRRLVSLRAVDGLRAIHKGRDGLTIGAMTTLRQIEADESVQSDYRALQEAVASIISVQVKNVATAVGNICVGTPASDVATALIALGASVGITSPGGERTIAIEDFFTGPRQTVLEPGDIVSRIELPPAAAGSTSSFVKLGRTATDVSKVAVAVALTIEDGVCCDVRIGLGAVAPTPVRAAAAEERLNGSLCTPAALEEASQLAAESAHPVVDIRSTAAYRERMVPVLVSRALRAALADRGGGHD